MLNIIKSDLYRILRGKAIYICILVIIAMSALSTIELSPGYIGMSSSNFEGETIYDTVLSEDKLSEEDKEELEKINSLKEIRKFMKRFPYQLDKKILAANINLYYIFIVITVIVLATDFSNSTVKNTISSSISRKKYYMSKLITILILCTFLVLFNNYETYFSNILINGKAFSSGLGEITKITLYQLPIMYGIISLLVCIGALTRKTAIFNTIAIPLIIVVQLLIMSTVTLFKINPDIYMWEYQNILAKLAGNSANDYIIKCAVLGIAYIVIFNIIGYKAIKKAEIK